VTIHAKYIGLLGMDDEFGLINGTCFCCGNEVNPYDYSYAYCLECWNHHTVCGACSNKMLKAEVLAKGRSDGSMKREWVYRQCPTRELLVLLVLADSK